MKNLFGFVFFLCYLVSFTSSFGNLPMGSNSSTPKLQTRQPKQPQIFLHSGFQASFRDARTKTKAAKITTCTLGFAVKRVKGNGKFDHGYLILGSCVPNRSSGGNFIVIAQVVNNGGEIEETVVGKSPSSSLWYRPELGLDFTIVKAFPDFWVPFASMEIFVLDDPHNPQSLRLIPIDHPQNPKTGSEVCFFGGYSGHVCGTVSWIDVIVDRPRPWYPYTMEYFPNMFLVTLNAPTPALTDQVASRDWGSPVYVPERDANGHITVAHPTGLFLAYCGNRIVVELAGVEATIPLGANERCFFYHPLDRILANEPFLELIRSPGH